MDSILLPTEIDLYVDTMKPKRMKEIGSNQWLEWHQRVQKLNQEALIEASALKEEHVKEALVGYKKINVLVHEAILINVWKHKVLPVLLKLEPRPESTFIAYSVLYHEAVCVALLELVMFHEYCCESLGDQAADLLDYLSGTSARLLSIKYASVGKKETPQEELFRQRDNLSFEIGIKSLSIVRYLSESINRLPVSILSKMYSVYDIPVLFAQILLDSPWNNDGKQYTGGKWRVTDGSQVTQAEAQVWLTLRQLILDPECPNYYAITESRKAQLLKILPLMTPVLLDQMSPLIELKHWLCRASAMDQTAKPCKPFIIETVLEIKEKILHESGGKWKKVAEIQRSSIFNNDKNALQETAQILSEAYNTDLLEKLDTDAKSNCARCGKDAIQRCSRCKQIWYCSRACQVENWNQHKEDCNSHTN